MREPPPTRLTLAEHTDLLQWLENGDDPDIDLNRVQNVHIWALVALATLAGKNRFPTRINRYYSDRNNEPSRFAHAVGYDHLVGGSPPSTAQEDWRTVRMRCVQKFADIEKVASAISHLVVYEGDDEETRSTLYYILVEFLRNAVQHSMSRAGAIVGAQLMDKTAEYADRPMIQVAVGDAGIGIMNSLASMHPEIADPHQALVMAQQPWISSRFPRGKRGSSTNAGLGLYFISEMAKRTAGRFLIASRGGSIFLEGDTNFQQTHHIRDERPGYAGTIVVFELPIGEIHDYHALISLIQSLATERIPRHIGPRLLRYEAAPKNVPSLRLSVHYGAEDTARAQRLVEGSLLPRVAQGHAIELDFAGLRVCTQSYLHALLFLVIKDAHERNVPIYIINAGPAVMSSLDFLESYALPE